MSWSKMKNIMIIILVFINLFLIVNVAYTKYSSQALPKSTAESFESILEKNGITLEDKVVPRYYETRRSIKAEAYDIDYLTNLLIGEKVKYVSDGQNIVAPATDKKLVISGGKIEYTTLKTSVEKNGRDILKALEKIGFSKTEAYFDSDTGYVKINIDSIPLEGVYLDVLLDAEGEIAYMSGVWPRITVGASCKASLISVVNTICSELPEGSHISSAEKIYVLESGAQGYIVEPGWIVYNQGRGYIIK